MEGAIK